MQGAPGLLRCSGAEMHRERRERNDSTLQQQRVVLRQSGVRLLSMRQAHTPPNAMEPLAPLAATLPRVRKGGYKIMAASHAPEREGATFFSWAAPWSPSELYLSPLYVSIYQGERVCESHLEPFKIPVRARSLCSSPNCIEKQSVHPPIYIHPPVHLCTVSGFRTTDYPFPDIVKCLGDVWFSGKKSWQLRWSQTLQISSKLKGFNKTAMSVDLRWGGG